MDAIQHNIHRIEMNADTHHTVCEILAFVVVVVVVGCAASLFLFICAMCYGLFNLIFSVMISCNDINKSRHRELSGNGDFNSSSDVLRKSKS